MLEVRYYICNIDVNLFLHFENHACETYVWVEVQLHET